MKSTNKNLMSGVSLALMMVMAIGIAASGANAGPATAPTVVVHELAAGNGCAEASQTAVSVKANDLAPPLAEKAIARADAGAASVAVNTTAVSEAGVVCIADAARLDAPPPPDDAARMAAATQQTGLASALNA